jgi:TMEM175 potassium channel family protein
MVRPARLTAFTDGVVAILITVLVLELRPPAGERLSDVVDLKGRLLAYLLSFVFVAVYWVNHHHLFQVVHRVDGRVLWANIHLLFWLSLTPVATAWLGDKGAKAGPVAAYTFVQLGCALAYYALTITLLTQHEPGSDLHRAIGNDRKGKLSIVAYAAAFALAFAAAWVSIGILVAVAVSWFVPDRRVTRTLDGTGQR